MINCNIWPIIPPQRGAVKWYWETPGDADDYPRIQFIERMGEIGRAEWKQEVGYHRRSLSETAMVRYKAIFGPVHYSRKLETQIKENGLNFKALNHMTAHGMPKSKPRVA